MSASEIVSILVENSYSAIAGNAAFDERTDEPETRASVAAGGFCEVHRVIEIFFRSV